MDFAIAQKVVAAGTTLILTVNPLSGLPLVLSATPRHEDPGHEAALRRIALTVALGTLAAALWGFAVLGLFGISPAAFMVGAGLLLAATGARSFVGARQTAVAVPPAETSKKPRRTRKTAPANEPQQGSPLLGSIAIAPIGFPILVGPGVLAVGALNGHLFGSDLGGIAVNAFLSVAAGAAVYAAYRAAAKVQTFMVRWQDTVTCVVGLILLCRGVEIVMHGIRSI